MAATMSGNIPNQSETSNPYNIQQSLYTALFKSTDRLIILRVEKSLINYSKSNSIQALKLDPMNSYYRLLAHQIADYYQLGHTLSTDGTSIVVFKSPDNNSANEAPKIKLGDISIEKETNQAKQTVKPKLIKKDSILTKPKLQKKKSSVSETSTSSKIYQQSDSKTNDQAGNNSDVQPEESVISDEPALESERASKEALYLLARERIFQASKDEEEDEEEDQDESQEFTDHNDNCHSKPNYSDCGPYDYQRFNTIPIQYFQQQQYPANLNTHIINQQYTNYPQAYGQTYQPQFNSILPNQQNNFFNPSGSSAPNSVYPTNNYPNSSSYHSPQNITNYQPQGPSYFNYNDSNALSQLNPYITTPNKYKKYVHKNHQVFGTRSNSSKEALNDNMNNLKLGE